MNKTQATSIAHLWDLLRTVEAAVPLVRGQNPLTHSVEERVDLSGLKVRGSEGVLSVIPDLKGGIRIALAKGPKIVRARLLPRTAEGLGSEKPSSSSQKTLARTMGQLLAALRRPQQV